MHESLSFRVKLSKTALIRVTIGKSNATLDTFRSSDVSSHGTGYNSSSIFAVGSFGDCMEVNLNICGLVGQKGHIWGPHM